MLGFQSLILHAPFKSKASSIAQLVKNPPVMQETPVDSWIRKLCWRMVRLPTPVFLGFPCGSVGKESAHNARDLGLIPGLGRSPGEGKGYPLQYSGLEQSMDCVVHRIAKSWTRLSDFHFHMYSNYSKEMFQFSSVTQSCLTLCDPMNCSTPGLPVHHQLPEFTQTHVH